MKNQTINFRVEEATRLQLKEISEELNLKESEFIRQAILSYRGLMNQAEEAAQGRTTIQELEGQIKRFNYVLETYEKNEALNSLFQQYRGHVVEGKKISTKSDLIELLAKVTTVEVIEENTDTEESAFSVSPINLQAQLTPEIVEEPITRQQIMNGIKRNWVLLLGLLVALGVFLFWRWTSIMKMRPKIIQFTPPQAEVTKVAA